MYAVGRRCCHFPFGRLYFFFSIRYWTMDKTPSGRPSSSHQHSQSHKQGQTSSSSQHQRHRSSSSTSSAGVINYHHLKRVCRERGVLFDDLDFPASARSLYANSKKPSTSPIGPITWLRPHVIITCTVLFFLSFFLSFS